MELSGCSNNNTQNNQDQKSSNEKTGVITASIGISASNFSPVGSTNPLVISANRHVLEGLYDVDLGNYRANAAIADGEPVKVGDLEYEIRIKKNKKFSDGSDLTIEDVVNSFQKNMASDKFAPYLSFIESVTPKDDSTLIFKLKYPFDLLFKSRISIVKIFPASQSSQDLISKPIGTGPWMYDSVDGADGSKITFVPNQFYVGNNKVEDSQMEWKICVDDDERAASLEQDNVLVAENVNEKNASKITSSGKTLEYVPGFECPFLMFNTQKEPFNNVEVRQAIFYALDIDKLISEEMGSHAKSVSCFLPESFANYHQTKTVFSFDKQKSLDLLKGARLKCELLVDSSSLSGISSRIKDNLSSVGIDVTLREEVIDWDSISSGGTALNFDFLLSTSDPSCICNDPDFLMSWWFGDNFWMRSLSGWALSAEWQDLQVKLQSARVEGDSNKQQSLFSECFEIIASNCVAYPLCHRDIASAYNSPKLTNFTPIATRGLNFLGSKLAS